MDIEAQTSFEAILYYLDHVSLEQLYYYLLP